MKIQLSDHFTYKKLIRFTIPSITMMIFTSIYSVVDGFFVSNFAARLPLRQSISLCQCCKSWEPWALCPAQAERP